MKGPLFYAKILLFGEYGIIKDSKGLSIPYNFYRGALKLSATGSFEDSTKNSWLSPSTLKRSLKLQCVLIGRLWKRTWHRKCILIAVFPKVMAWGVAVLW